MSQTIDPYLEVAIVDDHFVIQNGYAATLRDIPQVKDVSVFTTGRDFKDHVRGHRVDAVLLDIHLKDGENGLDICKFIKSYNEEIDVIMISADDSDAYVQRSARLGADGYLVKDSGQEEIVAAFSTVVLQGGKYFPATSVAEDTASNSEQELTSREREILALICQGKTSKEIADKLFRQESSINTHRTNIMRKLGVHNAAQLMQVAIKKGLYKP